MSCRAAIVLLGGCFALLAVFPTVARAARKGGKAEVAVNCELTEEGRARPHPTRQNPEYFVPVIEGWHEEGALVAGETPPKRADVLRMVGQALAREGYVLQALRPDANTTLPSLIITIRWGYLNPVITNEGAMNQTTGDGGTMSVAGMRDDPTQRESTHLNEREMVTLVSGAALQRQASFSEADWAKLNAAIAEDRYYLILCAYDFAASIKGEQKLLWTARMSTARDGVWMNDIVSALVTAGTPAFGRQTDVPKWTEFPVRDGKITISDPVVVDSNVKLPADKDASKPVEEKKKP